MKYAIAFVVVFYVAPASAQTPAPRPPSTIWFLSAVLKVGGMSSFANYPTEAQCEDARKPLAKAIGKHAVTLCLPIVEILR